MGVTAAVKRSSLVVAGNKGRGPRVSPLFYAQRADKKIKKRIKTARETGPRYNRDNELPLQTQRGNFY